MIALLPIRSENSDATGYVCTLPEEGKSQLEILISLGCKPHHRVLEIGCGALVAGFPIMQYLDAGNYTGIDPNKWLIESTLKLPEVTAVVVEKRPKFFPRADFRTGVDAKFDFIISHSILSHASSDQLTDFLVATAQQLTEGGVLAASIRLAEGNDVGSPGSARHGASFSEWQYPGVSWFKQADVLERARHLALSATVSPELTRTVLNGNPKAVHDWIVVRRTKVTLVSAFFRLPDRPVDEDEHFRRFDELARCGVPITLFLDERLMERAPRHENVRVVQMSLGFLRPFRSTEGLELSFPDSRNVEKDTRDFLLLQNSKIAMLELALVGDDSTHFAWIDFGIMKIVREPTAFLERLSVLSPPAKCVLAPGCWSKEQSGRDQKDKVDWRFCGGFLLADRTSITPLTRACDASFDRFVQNRKLLSWEVNVWASAERAGQHFDWYEADHDDSILNWKPVTDSTAPKICLVMIVRNESKIIERCLASALPYIDTWAITDTGSTDDTPAKIAGFFAKHDLPGQLTHAPFENFAQARNIALNAARSLPWNYALLIDGDMVLFGVFNKSRLTAPAYKIVQRNGMLSYFNTRLLRRDVPAQYVGVTHEYLSVEGVENLPGLIIDDRNDGGSKSDKGPRDIRLLNAGLAEEPDNERYMFYLAQVYREMGQHYEAIQWYRRRITRGGWDEEVWAAHYGIAHSYKELKDEPNFVKACIDAYDYRPARGEPLKLLAKFYRESSRNQAAILFADALARIPYPGDHLFVERDVYDFGADQEIAIAGYYVPKRRDDAYRICAELTVHQNDFARHEALKNFTFYVKSAGELFGAEVHEIEWKPENGWAPMNPSVCIGPTGRRLILMRTVNYTVTAEGQYPTIDDSGIIRTQNYILEAGEQWTPITSTPIKDVTGLPRSGYPVEGFEDCRLWTNERRYYASTTVRDLADNVDGHCETAIINFDDGWRVSMCAPVRDYEHEKTQKNWMPIVGRPGQFLYLCDPTIVIDTSTGTVEVARHESPVCLRDLRGGSQLIRHESGWICLTHEVAWRPERVYLHRFVKFDREFKVIAISDPFYFVKVGIEFCAGLARDGNKLIASFGVNDAAAYLATFDSDSVDRALKIIP